MQCMLFPKTSLIPPMRWVGGKTRGRKIISRYIPPVRELISPFLGGGSLELLIASRDNARIRGYDNYQPVVDVWHCARHRKSELIQRIDEKLQWIGTEKEKDFQPIGFESLVKISDAVDRAAYLIIKSALCFSGKWSNCSIRNNLRFEGGCVVAESPEDNAIYYSPSRIANFSAPTFTVNRADFRESLASQWDDWAYIDPPYVIKRRDYYSLTDFCHEDLARILWERKRFVLSYNDCPEVREFYPQTHFDWIFPDWTYNLVHTPSNEILILKS